jgi:hypothetical protein
MRPAGGEARPQFGFGLTRRLRGLENDEVELLRDLLL